MDSELLPSNLTFVKGYRCRFCFTHDNTKNYVCQEPGNVWAATICEDCVLACYTAIQELIKRQRQARRVNGGNRVTPKREENNSSDPTPDIASDNQPDGAA